MKGCVKKLRITDVKIKLFTHKIIYRIMKRLINLKINLRNFLTTPRNQEDGSFTFYAKINSVINFSIHFFLQRGSQDA